MKKCFWIDCEDKVSFLWIPYIARDPVWVCDKHFDVLSWVHNTEKVEVREDYTVVKVVPYENDTP